MSDTPHKPAWFNILGTPVLRKTSTGVFLLLLYSLLAIWKEHSQFEAMGDVPSGIHAALGFLLGLLLVFRTNTAYARWWEGRQHWGKLVNDSRNLSIKVFGLLAVPEAERARFCDWIIAFAYGLKDHLRGKHALNQLPGMADDPARPEHVPSYLVSQMTAQVGRWRSTGYLDPFDPLLLDRQLSSFLDVCGACERIRSTPISISYISFIRQSIMLYLLTLPWGLSHEFGNWTVLVVVMVSYFMLGIELLAETVEEPFGEDPDDLDLETICDGIERTVREITESIQPGTPAS